MAYDDRFYYGQAKVRVNSPSEGKTVSLHSSNDRYYTNTVEDGKADFIVPGTDYYDISLIDGEDTTHKGSVSVSYGECKTISIEGE